MKESLLVVMVLCGLIACSGRPPTEREQGAVAGGAIGAGAGAIVGNQAGHPGAGAAIGATAGVLTGGMVGDAVEDRDKKIAQQEEVIRRQEQELLRQQREIEDIKRQKFYNDSMSRFQDRQ